ncbi:MAG: hypothetical protein HKN32_06595, partial [Flavobacteriales bacterium]|nr:hypothetical protein [Flavobacteriales bacterium]
MKETEPDVGQDSIFTSYRVDYDALNDETTAVAWFNFGDGFGSRIELSDEAEVTFNGQAMNWKTLSAHYSFTTPGLV